jgi:hypothetical protein
VGFAVHLDGAGGGDAAPALEPVDLVLLEQKLDALGVALDGRLLVGEHLGQVDGGIGAHYAHLFKFLLGLVEEFGGVEHGLRGDAADVEAGAAKGFAALDAGGLEAELGAADGAHVAAGAGADDYHVILGH